MDTLSRSCLILVSLLFALTGYSQNMRTRSSTTTFATTNFGHTTHSNLTASTAVTAPAAGSVVLLASNNTFFSLSSAGVLTDLGAGGAGATAINDIGDASGDGQVGFGTTRQTWTTTRDSATESIFQLHNTVPTLSNPTVGWSIDYDDPSVVNIVYAKFRSDAAGAPSEDYVFGGAGFTISSGIPVTFNGGLSLGNFLRLPNAAAPTTDAFAEIAGDNNAWAASRGAAQFFDGTANTYLVGVLASDAPGDGQYPRWNTGGTVTWETISGSADATKMAATNGFAHGDFHIVERFIRPPAKTVNASIAVTGTNFWTIAANTNFTLTFTGAPTNGQLISLMVSNFAPVTDIIMTNTAGIFDFSVASNRTLITIASNSIALFGFRYTTNIGTGAGVWYLEQNMGVEYALEAGSNITLTTNGATRSISIAANSAAGDSAKVNETAASDSFSLTNTAASATVAATAWSITAGTDPDPDKVSVAIGAVSATVAGIVTAQAQTIGGAKTMVDTLTASSTIVHNGADQFKILTNAFSGFNVFLDLATNTMQFLLATNNFTLIPTNQNVGQRISFTMFNPTATSVTIVLPAVQIYGSGISNVVAAGKRLKSAWESQDAATTNISAAFAQQKN